MSRQPLAAILHQKKRITGIEPAYPAWEAGVLPMNYIRIAYTIMCGFMQKVKKKF